MTLQTRHVTTAFISTLFLAGCELSFDFDDAIGPDPISNLEVEVTSRTRATLTFIAPYDLGTGVSHYDIWLDSGASERVVSLDSSAWAGELESLELDELAPGREYTIEIAAVDYAGNRSLAVTSDPITTEFAYSGAMVSPDFAAGDNGFGYAVARADFNSDGFGDLAISAPFLGQLASPGTGSVYVYLGSATGLAAEPAIEIAGSEPRAQLGNALVALDWDGDGADDLAVGAPFAGGSDGAVYIFSAATLTGSLGATLTRADADVWISNAGLADGGAFGFTAVALDFDGDGDSDLAVSAPAAAGTGAVAIIDNDGSATDVDLGAGDADLHLFAPERAGELWGLFLAAVGSDLAIAGFQTDAVFLVRGRSPAAGVATLEFDPASDLEIVASGSGGSYFGASLAAIERDGATELAIGAYLDGQEAGAVTLAATDGSGTIALEDLATLTIRGAAGDQFGSAIASGGARGGDVDGDGIDDLVIVGGAEALELFVFYGDTLGIGELESGDRDHSLAAPGGMTGDEPTIGGSPVTAAWIGDVDGDGVEDLAWANWAGNDRDGLLEVLR